MIEAEWWEYDSVDEMADAVASDVGFIIGQAVEARGDALIALPGGRSPLPVFERLAKAKLNWRRVTIVPTDDRLVAVDSPLSNAAVLARHFLPLGARVVPLAAEAAADRQAAGAAADARLAALHWPPDLVWLGVGVDGHTASIFPGPDYAAALDAPKGRRAVGVLPEPLPAEAPVARVTLTRSAIGSARTLMLTLSGDEKRAVLERALEEGDASAYPIGRVLAAADLAIDIHWSPH
jgi:6-phosphogluconolactonase